MLKTTFLFFFLLIPLLSHADESMVTVPPVVVAEYREAAAERRFEAVIEAVKQATVSAQTSGQVDEIFFDVDDHVKKGDVLLRLRATEQRASLARVRAEVKEAEARYREASSEHARYEKLYTKQAVSKSAMDSIKADLSAAKARLAASRAALKQADEQAGYTVITAPYSGVVVERHVQVGENAVPGKALMTGISLENLRAVAQVPQNTVETIRQYRKARIIVDSNESRRSIEGGEISIVPYADPRTHTFKVRIELPSDTNGIYPGMFVKAAFAVGMEKNLLLPSQAVAYRGEVRAVYVVAEDGSLSMRQVRVGRSMDGGVTEILSGLREGERVCGDPVKAAAMRKQGIVYPPEERS